MSKMHISKTALLICILFFICSSLGLAFENRLVVPLPDCGVTLAKDTYGDTVFKGAVLGGVSGNPALPVQNITLLLPPNTALDTVKTTVENPVYEIIPGTWEVKPVPPETASLGKPEWPAGATIIDGRNIEVYRTNQFFPINNLGRCSTGYQRSWCLAQLQIFPYQYNPSTKVLRRLTGGNLVVTFNKTDKTNTLDPLSQSLRGELSRRVLNFEDMLPLYQYDAINSSTNVKPGYVIITTRAIQNASQQLNKFIDEKTANGFDVRICTESTWGGGTGNTAADNIRAWLQANYISHNIKYVLLIGNPHPETGDIPMKMCYPRQPGEDYNECPTDLYYADLTGNWDLDRDGRYGEFNGDYGATGADLNCEVIVGRIPYYGNINDLDHILAKTISYSNTPSSETGWRSRVLLPMEPSDSYTPGYQLGEAIKDNVLIPKTGWSWYRIYDDTYSLNPAPETVPCDIANVVNAWNSNKFGLVCWWTHGSSVSASSIMDIWTVPQLDDTHPAFTFQCSCNNSWPESPDNLSYTLLRHGAIATISGTRVTWYSSFQTGDSTNCSMTYEYAKRLVGEGLPTGDALQDLKATILPGWSTRWMNYLSIMLYGDPSLSLTATTPVTKARFSITQAAVNPATPQVGDKVKFIFTATNNTNRPIPAGTILYATVIKDGVTELSPTKRVKLETALDPGQSITLQSSSSWKTTQPGNFSISATLVCEKPADHTWLDSGSYPFSVTIRN